MWAPDDDLPLWVGVSPTPSHQAKSAHLPTREENFLIILPQQEQSHLSTVGLVFPFTVCELALLSLNHVVFQKPSCHLCINVITNVCFAFGHISDSISWPCQQKPRYTSVINSTWSAANQNVLYTFSFSIFDQMLETCSLQCKYPKIINYCKVDRSSFSLSFMRVVLPKISKYRYVSIHIDTEYLKRFEYPFSTVSIHGYQLRFLLSHLSDSESGRRLSRFILFVPYLLLLYTVCV